MALAKLKVNVRGRPHWRSSRELQSNLLAEIQALESRAHQLGMTVTGHALNNAKNAAGWELAGETELAGKAARGDRADASRS